MICPVCGTLQSKYWYKRHLVKAHGWLYDGNEPKPPEEVGS